MPLIFTMIKNAPIQVIPSNNSYYLAQRFSKEVLPILLREELFFTQTSYQDTPVFTNLFPFSSITSFSMDLVPQKEEKKIIEMTPSFWFEGYEPWISLFDRVIEQAGNDAIRSNATHFSLDMFTAHLWFSDFPEYYLGLGLSARLRKYTPKVKEN